MKRLLFCWMRKDADAGGVDATWRISSSSLRMCARQDCFVFERPQVVFYCNVSCSRHVSKSANLIGRIVFDAARQTKKTNPRHFSKWRFYAWRFSCRCAHSHWRPLFSQEALNVGEYRVQNTSRCVRAFILLLSFFSRSVFSLLGAFPSVFVIESAPELQHLIHVSMKWWIAAPNHLWSVAGPRPPSDPHGRFSDLGHPLPSRPGAYDTTRY